MTTPFPFVASSVLTAAQLNAITTLPIAAKTANYTLAVGDVGYRVQMTAAGSTTITVNTGIFSAGDTIWIQNMGAGTCTITAGTATVTTAGSLAVSQYGGGELFFTSASAATFFPSGGKSVVTNIATFTSSGTWTVPTGVTYAVAHIRGGGGGIGWNSSPGAGGNSSVAFVAGTKTANGGVACAPTYGGSIGAGTASRAGADNSGNGATTFSTTFDSASSTISLGGNASGQNGAEVVHGGAVTAAASITITVGAGGTAGANTGAAGGSGLVWIEYEV